MSAKRYCPMCDEWMRQTECPKCGMPTDKALPEHVKDWVQRDWDSPFGAALFNLYTEHTPCGDQWFSQRAAAVRRMLAAMRATPEPHRALCEHQHECGWTFDFAAKRVYCRQCEGG